MKFPQKNRTRRIKPHEYNDFAEAVDAVGMSPRDCGRDHWQIRGGVILVNYWPGVGKIHANGDAKAYKGTGIDAINRAGGAVPPRHVNEARVKAAKAKAVAAPPASIPCPYCGGRAVRCETSNHLYSKNWGPVYDCRPCDAYVGVHKDSGHPKGTPADRETRESRKLAHSEFDRIWKGGQMTRQDAYAWLASRMGITGAECHIALFDSDQCGDVVAIVRSRGRR